MGRPRYIRLDRVCDVIDPHPSHRAPKAVKANGIPFVGIGDFDSFGKMVPDKARHVSPAILEEHKERYGLDEDLLLLGRVASIGKVVKLEKMDRPFVVSPTLAVIRPKEVNIDYLRYALQSPEFVKQMLLASTGSTRKSVGMKALRKLDLPLFSEDEQKRIVAILDQAFEGIDKAIANTEQNLKNARELFDSKLSQLFTKHKAGWSETTIGDQLTLQRGFDITKKDQVEGPVPVVSSGGIKSHHNVFKAHAPGVVIGRKGSLGTVHFLDQDYWPHDTTLWVKDFKGNHARLAYYLFRSLDLKKLDSGTANPALNRNLVHPLRVFWPSIDLQEHIVTELDNLLNQTQQLEQILKEKKLKLNGLKQSLLQKAFSGELSAATIQEAVKVA